MVSMGQTQMSNELEPQSSKLQRRRKILLVDDDVELLVELKEMLTYSNYDVEIMFNSGLAFEKTCELKPDLVILDLKMKPKSGFQLADELQNSILTKQIPIIAITGFFTDREHVLMMKMCGMKHVILKPFNPTDILAKIKAVLDGTDDSVSPSVKT